MRAIILKYGLIAGSIILGVLLIGFATQDPENMDMTLGMIIGYISMLAAFSFVFVAIIQARDRHLDGMISFGTSFKIGILIVLIASAIYSLGWTIYVETSSADFYEMYSKAQIEKIEQGEATPEEKQIAIEAVKSSSSMFESPVIIFLMTLTEPLIPGLIITLIAAAILKRSNGGAKQTA